MGKLRDNIFWVTETEEFDNYISMQVPERNLVSMQGRYCSMPKRCCCHNGGIEIDMSNKIIAKAESEANIEDNKIEGSTVGDITGGSASSSVGIDAVQVSVLVVVPIIDSFDSDAIPLNGAASRPSNYRVAAGGQNLDIQVNGDGTAFVNGEQLEQSELIVGTKVYVYKSDQQHYEVNSEKK